MNLLLVFLAFGFIAGLALPGMVKGKLWRDVVIYSVMFVLVLVLAVLVVQGVEVPSPIKAIQAFYRDVLHLTFQPS